MFFSAHLYGVAQGWPGQSFVPKTSLNPREKSQKCCNMTIELISGQTPGHPGINISIVKGEITLNQIPVLFWLSSRTKFR
jgi:hypothetical protein